MCDATGYPMSDDPKDQPMYAIMVATEALVAVPEGLSAPPTRLYSQHDLDRFSSIQKLSRDLGMHLAGVEEISRLQQELESQKQQMQQRIEQLNAQIQSLEDQVDQGQD
ncbi:MAG: helix-turn-helix transcriptional regulator [Synechococcales cyanobacterium]